MATSVAIIDFLICLIRFACRSPRLFRVLCTRYDQIPISEETQKYLKINTIQGLYVFTRLPFGVHSAPAIFQKIMDTVLAGIPNVICYLDNIREQKPPRESTRFGAPGYKQTPRAR